MACLLRIRSGRYDLRSGRGCYCSSAYDYYSIKIKVFI